MDEGISEVCLPFYGFSLLIFHVHLLIDQDLNSQFDLQRSDTDTLDRRFEKIETSCWPQWVSVGKHWHLVWLP